MTNKLLLRRRHFLLNEGGSPRSSSSVTKNTGGDIRVSESGLKILSSEFWRDNSSFIISFQQANKLIISCRGSAVRRLFKSMSSNTLMPAAVMPSPLFSTVAFMFFLRVRLRFLNFFKDASLLNFKILFACELLVLGVRQLEEIFSVVKYEFVSLA